ncbi:MAG: FecCD family ABC transporter permease, partial [Christensenellaceae bacterium]
MRRNKAYKITLITALCVACALAIIVCVGIGSVPYDFLTVLKVLFADDQSSASLIIRQLRLPRILTAGLVGICLALSGCILQGVMRNDLASPTTIGVTSGASFVGYLTLVAFPAYSYLLPIGSILGAFCTTMLIYALAYSKGVSTVRIILSGLAVSALFSAFNDVIRTFFADSLGNASSFLVGGLNGVVWKQFFLILPYALVGIGAILFLPRSMNILLLGDESANALGLRTERFRFLLIVISSLLSGAAISVAGLISFVGLLVPHIARLLVGSDYRYLFPASGLFGF